MNKIPPNTGDIQVGKFTYHEVDVEKVANRSLTESFLKEGRKNMRFFFHVIIYWKTTVKEKDRVYVPSELVANVTKIHRRKK